MNRIISAYYHSGTQLEFQSVMQVQVLLLKQVVCWYIVIYHVDHVTNISVVIKTDFYNIEFNMM